METVYKCVAVPDTVLIDKKTSHLESVKSIEAIINREAAGGWRYVGIEEVASHFSPGCFGSLFNIIPIVSWFVRGEENVHLRFMVFEQRP